MTGSKDRGVIFDIKRFAIHDGEGIRTTLFLKGCPLRCPWCHNPEGRKIDIELMWFESLCVSCAECERVCRFDAIKHKEGKTIIDKKKCTICGDCVIQCPALALKLDGKVMTGKEAFEELMKDEVFFMQSGGITLSGGDPLFQADFALSILKLCKQKGMNTTIETCLFSDKDTVQKFLPLVDKFFVDIKIFNDKKHKDIIGASNVCILENFEMLCKRGENITVRIPLIPKFTDDDENISEIAKYVKSVNDNVDIELLNYNPLAESKFLTIEEPYQVGHLIKPLEKSILDKKRKIVFDILEGKNED